MARPLRIEMAGGRYHVTARGNERRDIFRDERDRQHFVELLAALPERFGVRLHSYVLMPNHYHLLLETPEANLSRTVQWLNVSYSVWFNRRHRRSGHLLQGRFGAAIVEDEAGWQEVGRYVHLNPVRVARLGLDKAQRARRPVRSDKGAFGGDRRATVARVAEMEMEFVPGLRGLRPCALVVGWRDPRAGVRGTDREGAPGRFAKLHGADGAAGVAGTTLGSG